MWKRRFKKRKTKQNKTHNRKATFSTGFVLMPRTSKHKYEGNKEATQESNRFAEHLIPSVFCHTQTLAFDMPFLIPNNDNDDRQVDIYDEHQRVAHANWLVCEPKPSVSLWVTLAIVDCSVSNQTPNQFVIGLEKQAIFVLKIVVQITAANWQILKTIYWTEIMSVRPLNESNVQMARSIFFILSANLMIRLNFLILKHFARWIVAVLSILTNFQLNSTVNYLVMAGKKPYET